MAVNSLFRVVIHENYTAVQTRFHICMCTQSIHIEIRLRRYNIRFGEIDRSL